MRARKRLTIEDLPPRRIFEAPPKRRRELLSSKETVHYTKLPSSPSYDSHSFFTSSSSTLDDIYHFRSIYESTKRPVTPPSAIKKEPLIAPKQDQYNKTLEYKTNIQLRNAYVEMSQTVDTLKEQLAQKDMMIDVLREQNKKMTHYMPSLSATPPSVLGKFTNQEDKKKQNDDKATLTSLQAALFKSESMVNHLKRELEHNEKQFDDLKMASESSSSTHRVAQLDFEQQLEDCQRAHDHEMKHLRDAHQHVMDALKSQCAQEKADLESQHQNAAASRESAHNKALSISRLAVKNLQESVSKDHDVLRESLKNIRHRIASTNQFVDFASLLQGPLDEFFPPSGHACRSAISSLLDQIACSTHTMMKSFSPIPPSLPSSPKKSVSSLVAQFDKQATPSEKDASIYELKKEVRSLSLRLEVLTMQRDSAIKELSSLKNNHS